MSFIKLRLNHNPRPVTVNTARIAYVATQNPPHAPVTTVAFSELDNDYLTVSESYDEVIALILASENCAPTEAQLRKGLDMQATCIANQRDRLNILTALLKEQQSYHSTECARGTCTGNDSLSENHLDMYNKIKLALTAES